MSNKFLYDGIDFLYNVQVKGEENLNTDTPTIYISNQVSILDFRFVLNRLPENTYVIASEDFLNKFPTLKNFQDNVVVIKEGTTKSIKTILNMLKEGKSLLIYPEGTLTKTGTLMALQNGVSYFARKSKVKIQPIVIEGMERSPLSHIGKSGLTSQKHFPNVQLTIGEPFYLPEESTTKVEQLALDNDYIYGKLNELLLKATTRENRNLWNDLLDAAELYGHKRAIFLDENKDSYTYKEFINQVQVISKPMELINGNRVGVFIPESLYFFVSIFSMFMTKKNPVVFPVDETVKNLYSIKNSSLETLITSRRFLNHSGLEDEFKELEKELEVIYIDELMDSLSKRRKEKETRVAEDLKLHISFVIQQENQDFEVKFSHEQLYAGVRQNQLTIGRTVDDLFFSLLPCQQTLGFSFGFLFPLLSGIPFISTYLSSTIDIGKLIYKIQPSIIIAEKNELEKLRDTAHSQHLNSVNYTFCPMTDTDPVFQMKWIEKFRKVVYEGYYNNNMCNFYSLNTSTQYQYGTLGRIMPGNELVDGKCICLTGEEKDSLPSLSEKTIDRLPYLK